MKERTVDWRRERGTVAVRKSVGQRETNLEAVLIGNAAAALQGAPVTTADFDFYFRRTPRNLVKLKLFARRLGATVLRPYYSARCGVVWRSAPITKLGVLRTG
jgi:hypothetical protein